MKLAIDAMGGDFAPRNIVAGAVEALRDNNRISHLYLVGDQIRIDKDLRKLGASDKRIEIIHASEVIEMNDPPVQSVRRKKDSSIAVGVNLLKNGGFVDPLKPEGQVELSRNLQIATAAIDSTGMCLFIAFAVLDQPETFQALIDLLNAFYGWNLTGDDVTALGKKVLKMERDFNAKAGFTKEHDRLPRFFYTDPVGPHNITFQVKDEEMDGLFNW